MKEISKAVTGRIRNATWMPPQIRILEVLNNPEWYSPVSHTETSPKPPENSETRITSPPSEYGG